MIEQGIPGDAHRQALRHLYTCPERSPYIAYTLVSMSGNTTDTILKYEKFTTLYEYLKHEPEQLESLVFFGDVLQGSQFLIANNLRLMDLYPDNIALYSEPKSARPTAKLFDLELLYDDMTPVLYMTKSNLFSPERYAFRDQPMPISEKEMVYELGKVFDMICLRINVPGRYDLPRNLSKTYGMVWDLYDHMVDQNPENRYTVGEALQALDVIVQKVEQEKSLTKE